MGGVEEGAGAGRDLQEELVVAHGADETIVQVEAVLAEHALRAHGAGEGEGEEHAVDGVGVGGHGEGRNWGGGEGGAGVG